MDNKQYNALFSFIWNIANDLPNSRKKGYLILGLTTMAVLLSEKMSEKILAVMLTVMLVVKLAVKMAVIMSPVCPQFVPSSVTSCHKSVTSWKENVLKLNMNPES